MKKQLFILYGTWRLHIEGWFCSSLFLIDYNNIYLNFEQFVSSLKIICRLSLKGNVKLGEKLKEKKRENKVS